MLISSSLVKFNEIFRFCKIYLISFHTNVFCVNAGMITVMSIADGISSYIFRRKTGKTQSMRTEMDGLVFLFTARVCNFSL